MTNLEAAETLEKVIACGNADCFTDSGITCENCPNNISPESDDEAIRLAIEALRNQSEIPTGSDTISRQDAIDAAIEAADDWDGGCSKERERFIREALEELPSAQPVGTPLHDSGTDYAKGYEDGYRKGLKDAQPERKNCEWIITKTERGWNCAEYPTEVTCSNCNYIEDYQKALDFCPNCGADMRKPKLQYGDDDTLQGGLISAT